MEHFDRDIQTIGRLLEDLFLIDAIYHQGADKISMSIRCRYETTRSLKMIRDRLTTAGYEFELDSSDEPCLLIINPRPRRKIPTTNIVMFVTTVIAVYLVPVYLRMLNAAPTFSAAWDDTVEALKNGAGIMFTMAMISILFVHEMGHYIAGRRRNIVMSWPFFIPAPSIIGTFGAIIKSKSPFWNRRDLIEVGAAGPIAGWIVALIWLIYGLSHSQVMPPNWFNPTELAFSMDGESILMRFLTGMILGTAPEGHYFLLSEAAFAGWVGLLVTALNLLPIGQLDGGHILYGLVCKRQHILGIIATVGLVAMGFLSPTWWVFAAFGLIFGMKHPPTLHDATPPGPTARAMGWIALAILVISFTPVPFQ
ncbi:MAG TPA: site-2 protease family protein [candidate division Zixibacteria bacterium]|nr:site-2 protease family protein [candidate division Zixibacteria bacterium]